ncbi:CAMKK protein kinase [Phytophthora nicotianae P1976]|uniref:CAMKK protein kinase n=1 Tax=Phytophthora nicotianae P1976 TaxID=1317066 RepID=A0A080Z2H5_PHYNI|nr:CAMKK protein kinase [Phytophthora nicotianae P1976]
MSGAFSNRVQCDLGIFDFFRSRTMSFGHRESRSASHSSARASSNRPKTGTRSLAPSASMPPPAPASAPSSVAAHVNSSNVPPPLPESMDSVTTTASAESFNNNDHLSDDDDDSDSDSDDGISSASSGDSGNSSVGSAITKYEVVRELGRGATAVVQLGRLRGGDDLVALKVFKTSLLKKMREVKRVGRRMVVSTALDKVQVEIAIMKKLHHPNLLNLLEVFDDDSETLVLMLEYAPSGQVMQWFPEEKLYKKSKNSKEENECFTEEELRVCVRQLLLGLEYLHENNICHRDLKPENILVGQDGTYKIADFGVAHFFEEDDKEAKAKAAGEVTPTSTKPHKKGYVSTTAGTYAFMGPETLKGGEYSAYAADIWALGVSIHALAFGTIPFYDPDVVTLFEMIEKNPIELENNASEGLSELLYGLLEKDPEKRWSLQQCKEHSWVLEGLSDQEKKEYVETSYEAVKVGPEDLACAVTRVTSLNVILRVKLGVNKWKRKAMRTLEERRKSLHDGGSSFGESPSSRFSSVSAAESIESETKQPAATRELANNQLEI